MTSNAVCVQLAAQICADRAGSQGAVGAWARGRLGGRGALGRRDRGRAGPLPLRETMSPPRPATITVRQVSLPSRTSLFGTPVQTPFTFIIFIVLAD